MDKLNNIYELLGTFNMIPEGTNEKVCVNGLGVFFSKKNGTIHINIEMNKPENDCNYSFDDSKVKEKIANYKENIEALDDNTFLDILDEMREVIDIKEFDDLLEMEYFTKESAARVEELIDHSTLIVHKFLQNKIQDLMELYERF